MSAQLQETGKTTHAIAVRDGLDLFLVLSICRSDKTDVYVNFPRDHVPDWKPHSSYHASGQHHQKGFGHKALVRQRQKPDSSFTGNQNIVTTFITATDPRAINAPCVPSNFEGLFEIPVAEISFEMDRTYFSVDLIEPYAKPIAFRNVIRQVCFRDAVPWILVTVYGKRT